MDLDGNHRILKIRLPLPDLGLSCIIRRVSFRVPNAVMGSNRPNPVEWNASVGCNIPHDEHLPDGHFVFRGKGGERAAPSDVPRYSSIIMVPSITFVGIFFHTDISIKSSQNQVPAMFEVTNNI